MLQHRTAPGFFFLYPSGIHYVQADNKAPPQRRIRELFEKKLCSIVSSSMQHPELRFSNAAFFNGDDVIANAKWLSKRMGVAAGTVERNFRDHEFSSRKLKASDSLQLLKMSGWKVYTHLPRRFIQENVAAGKKNLLKWMPASRRRAGSGMQAQTEVSGPKENGFDDHNEIKCKEMGQSSFEDTMDTVVPNLNQSDHNQIDYNQSDYNQIDYIPLYFNLFDHDSCDSLDLAPSDQNQIDQNSFDFDSFDQNPFDFDSFDQNPFDSNLSDQNIFDCKDNDWWI